MKKAGSFIIAFVLAIAPAVSASAAEKTGRENISFTMAENSTMTSKVTDIDRQARTVTLADADGSVRTVSVGQEISNFGQLRKGDTVTIEVQQRMDVEVQPGPGHTLNIGAESRTSALPGQKPSGMRIIEGTLKTQIESIDHAARTFTCKNRKGVLTTYKVGNDAKRFDEVRRGDMLVVEYKQVTVLSVK